MRTKLAESIKSKGYNPHQVAGILGFHKTTLYNHIRGDNILGIQKARKLAAFLNIPIEDIYCDN